MKRSSRAAGVFLAFVTGTALFALGVSEPGPMTAEESLLLARSTTAALVGVALLAPATVGPLGLLVVALAWWLPPGIARPSAIAAAIVLASCIAVAGRLREPNEDREDPLPVLGLALVLVALPGGSGWVGDLSAIRLAGLLAPVAILVPLARDVARLGPERSALAAAALAVTVPGFGSLAALSLGAAALATSPRRTRGLAALLPLLTGRPEGLWAGGAVAVTLAVRELPRRAAAAVGLLASACGAGALLLGGGLPALPTASLPLLVLAPVLGRPGPATAVAVGAVLGGVGLASWTASPAGPWLAGGVALLAVAEPERRGAPAAGRRVLAAGILGGALVAAAYPWLRSEPVEAVLAGLFRHPTVPVTVFVLLAFAGALSLDRFVSSRAAVVVASGLLLAAVATSPRILAVPLEEAPRALAEGAPVLRVELPASTRSVVLDTQLVHGGDLGAGQRVAAVLVRDPEARILLREELRVGRDTADWAAARLPPGDPARRLAAFSHRVAETGDLLARRYRTVVRIGPLDGPGFLEVRRRPDLPPETRLIVLRLEVRG